MAGKIGIIFLWVLVAIAFFIALFIIHNYGKAAPIKLKWKDKFDANIVDNVFRFHFPPRLNFGNEWSQEQLGAFSKFFKLPSISLFHMSLKALSIASLIAMTTEFFAQEYVLLPQKPGIKLSTWASIVTTPIRNDWVLAKRNELPLGWADLPQDTSFPLPSNCKSIDGETRTIAYNFAWNGHSQDNFGNCESGCGEQENYTVTSQNYFAQGILYTLIGLACFFFFVYFSYSIPQAYDLARFEERWQAEHIGRNRMLKRRQGMSLHSVLCEPILEFQFQANWLKKYYSMGLWVATLFATCQCLQLEEFSERCGCCAKVAVCFSGVAAVGAVILGAGMGFLVQVNTLIMGPTLVGRLGAFFWIYSFISLLPFSAHLLYVETYIINIALFIKGFFETCGKVFQAKEDLERGDCQVEAKTAKGGAGFIEINFETKTSQPSEATLE